MDLPGVKVLVSQNLVLVVIYWHYTVPPVAWSERIAVSVFGAALVLGMILSTIPLACAVRIPAIIANFANGHTGPLSPITFVLNFGGLLARVFTTLTQVNDV
ncbi:uncharacterized protein AMSG_03480 [Thecamonas trahens ATCC 50062]|uniref:Uncharacterized protein n=1 Tax=Thecamonas trahens ATCC 50062 TaxID=461836 RepID=A0A0L0D4N7_THETB|nr:hypothetical protein AMSG_03480 [Thecamonas trahens ATCC 50062]KNC47056.1 hypothetical protein AMSG_03480 [Thecamonas trahens ATCC 50062]|eukprot:XP_013759836.1 hypothetical protein AMSG_03480 [Thecamonas trahens ATCC 50062]